MVYDPSRANAPRRWRDQPFEDHRPREEPRAGYRGQTGRGLDQWTGPRTPVDHEYGWSGEPGDWDRQSARGHGKPPAAVRWDERIRDDVIHRLAEDWRLDGSDIDVEVEDSEVYLFGLVDSQENRYRAGDLAAGIHGVRIVHNDLDVVTDLPI